MRKNVLTILGQQINFPYTDDKKESKDDMEFINNIDPGHYKNGYFYIKDHGDKENIMFFDYDSKKEVYLCHKPNCKHDNDTCSSYSNLGATNELFYYHNALYFISSTSDSVNISITGDGVLSDSGGIPTTIYKMNLNGTERQKLFTAPSGTKLDMPFVISGNMLYGYLEKSKVEDNGNHSFTMTTTERKLIAVNLSTRKYEELKEDLHASFIGTYQHKLVIQEIDYLNDPNNFNDNTYGFIDNLYHSKARIKLFDPETKKEEVIYEDVYKNVESLKFYKNGIYMIGQKSKNLEYVDFSTKQKKVLKELPESDMEIGTIIDDKILVYTYKDKDAHVGEAYYIDLTNHEMHPFNLKDQNEYLVDILASNDDYYFVKIESIYGEEYTTWAGTQQQDIIGISYGLIKKSDYWDSKPNYIKMTNAK